MFAKSFDVIDDSGLLIRPTRREMALLRARRDGFQIASSTRSLPHVAARADKYAQIEIEAAARRFFPKQTGAIAAANFFAQDFSCNDIRGEYKGCVFCAVTSPAMAMPLSRDAEDAS